VGADLVHNLGDGEGSEILLKEKCLDDVVSWLGVTPDFPKETKCIPICMPGSSFMHIVT
jgi:hypothetical protein